MVYPQPCLNQMGIKSPIYRYNLDRGNVFYKDGDSDKEQKNVLKSDKAKVPKQRGTVNPNSSR